MEPLEYFAAFEDLFTVADIINTSIERVQTNKELCAKLRDQIDKIMRPARNLRQKAAYSEDLKKFVEVMQTILDDAKKMVDKLESSGKVKQFLNSRKYDNQLHHIIERLKLLSTSPMFLLLAKQYDDTHLKSVSLGNTWDIPAITDACLFCHVTHEGHIIIGGQKSDTTAWRIMAYDSDGNQLWHWVLLEELGRPVDISQVTVLGPRNETQHYLAIVCQEHSEIVLFDPEDRSVLPEAAFKLTEADVQISRIQRMVAPQRLVLSVNPSLDAPMDSRSHLTVLNCRKLPFTEIKKIAVDCMEIISLSFISHSVIGVACGRPNNIFAYDINDGTKLWNLPSQLDGKDLSPEGTCGVAGDVCVYDKSFKRILTASHTGWGATLLADKELAGVVYGIAWNPQSGGTLIVLHNNNNRITLSLFDLHK